MADQFGSYQWITANDLNRSVTAGHLPDVFRALRPLTQDRIEKILDLGCGFGGVGKTVGAHLNAHEVHGIDIDAEALEEARQKGLITHQVDVGREPLPFSDGYFDLVTCFGMLDYLPLLDHPIREVFRVLDRGGACSGLVAESGGLAQQGHVADGLSTARRRSILPNPLRSPPTVQRAIPQRPHPYSYTQSLV